MFLKVVAESGSVGVWIWLPLLLHCSLQMVKPHNRRDCRSENQKALRQHHILECLSTWKGVDGFARLDDNVFCNCKQYKLGHEGVNIKEKDLKVNYNIKPCLRKVANGHFTTVVKVSGSYGVAYYNAHTMKVLEARLNMRTNHLHSCQPNCSLKLL